MNIRFWRNVGIITAAHIAAIVTFARWTHKAAALNTPVIWLNGAADAPASSTLSASLPAARPNVRSHEDDDEDPDDFDATMTKAKSEIQLPVTTPTPAATAKPVPSATPPTSPSPKVKVPPKPHPKPTPTVSPKPKPKPSLRKMVLAAKSTPKPRLTPYPTEEKKEVDPAASASPAQPNPGLTPVGDSPSHSEKVTSSATAGHGHGGGATIQSQFGWYGSMLHDRFYSEWAQPSSLGSNSKASALVKVRIEKDGRISDFQIVRSSGNATVDESINAVAKRVTKVDPLPAGLGGGEHYDVKINFELNSD